MTSSRNAAKSVELSNEINQFTIETSAAMQSPNVCGQSLTSIGTTSFTKNTFISNSPSSIDIGELKYTNGQSIAKAGNNIPGSSAVRITSVKLSNYRPMGVVAGETRFIADLQIDLLKGTPGQVVGGSHVKPSKIPVLIRMNDATGAFIGCSSFGMTVTFTTPPLNTADCVNTYGPGWTWSGSACVPPSQTCPSRTTNLCNVYPNSMCPIPVGTQGQIWQYRDTPSCWDYWQCINGTWVAYDTQMVNCGEYAGGD